MNETWRENLKHYYSFWTALINIHSILIRLRLTFVASSISEIKKILFRTKPDAMRALLIIWLTDALLVPFCE